MRVTRMRATPMRPSASPACASPSRPNGSAAPRILAVRRGLVAVRRRHSWLADASVVVRQASLENAYAELVLTPPADAGDAHAGDADAPVGVARMRVTRIGGR